MLPSFYDTIYGEGSAKRFQVLYGGAGSGKSYSIAQHLVSMALERSGLDILCVRKTRPAARLSCLVFVERVLRSIGMEYTLNRTDLELRVGGSTFYFKGVDDAEKFKSAEFHLVWMEEATEFKAGDFEFLNMRCRSQFDGPNGRVFLTFNPTDRNNWAVSRFVVGKDPNAHVMHSTYRDNPYLPVHDVDQLKRLETIDENFFRVYCLGEPGILKGLVYSSWSETEAASFPDKGPSPRRPDCLGLDLGHKNPTCLVAVWRSEKRLYIRELLYRTDMSTGDLVGWLAANIPDSWRDLPIYTAPERPEVIEDIYRAGFNAKPAANKVYDGIMYVRSFELLVDGESINTVRELRSYKWKEDKHGNPVDEPVKWMDHAPDAIRYAVFSERPAMPGGGAVILTDADMAFMGGAMEW